MELAEEIQEEIVDKLAGSGADSDDHEMDDVRHSIDDDPFFSHEDGGAAKVPACREILANSLWHADTRSGGGPRLWDVLHLLPVLVFLIFLFLRKNHTRVKVEGNQALEALFCVISGLAVAGAARALVNLLVQSFFSNVFSSVMDRLGWTLLRSYCLAAELLVPALASLATMLDPKRVSRLILGGVIVALLYWLLLLYQDIG